MIAHSKWLWRYVLVALMILTLHLLTLLSFTYHHNESKRETQVVYVMYLAFTSILTLSTFGIVFKKAASGTFGYDKPKTLLLKFRLFGVLSCGLFASIVPIFMISAENSYLFALSTLVNSLCFALLSRTYVQEHLEIRRYLHFVMSANSHKGVTLSVQEAHMCYRLDAERTKLQSVLSKEHRSVGFEALQNVHYYNLMRYLHKLRLLAAANERERQWRISELYHEINEHASTFELDAANAEDWKQLADHLDITFPFSQDSEFANYENQDFGDDLETVD